MAQDTSFRSVRSDDPYARDPAPAGRNSDPLTELARLIGQEDPFASRARRGGQGSGQAEPAQAHGDHRQDAPEWHRPGAHGAEPAYHDRPATDPYAHSAAHEDGRYQYEQRYDDPQYGTEAYAADGYYDDNAYDQQGYDEPPREKRRGGLMTVAAVVGLAVVGTVGVFGYRAWTQPSGTGGEPPVIKAEQAPTKIVPAAASSENQPVKQQYDRVGERGGERVVPREEQPVDPRMATRAVSPVAPVPSGPTGSVLPPLPAPTQSPVSAANEPKKVKTVAIRPEQPPAPVSGTPAIRPAPAAAPTPAAAPPPARPAQTAPAQTAPSRVANVENGGYVVQVASQRSEADAHASFKALQQKYSSVLGGYQGAVKRADLGDKGVYYRAQVGPFATAEQANEMCSSLKSAGGQCIVQRN